MLLNLKARQICRGLIALFIYLLPSCILATPIEQQLQQSLKQLDTELANSDKYLQKRISNIDSIKSLLHDSPTLSQRLNLLRDIGDNYKAFNIDSALRYYTYGYDLSVDNGLTDEAASFRLRRATYLPLIGYIDDALTEFKAVNAQELSPSLLKEYHDAGKQMYSYIASFYNGYRATYDYWMDYSKDHARKGLEYSDSETAEHLINRAELLYLDNRLNEAKSILMATIDDLSSDNNLYARANHMLAEIARIKGDLTSSKYYLAQSALADIRGAVLEVMALQELGVALSDDGDINRAHSYLEAALSNAVLCNASMRIIQTSSALPLIQKSHNKQIANWRNKIYVIISILGVILVLLALSLFFLRRQMKRKNALQDKLSSANRVKEIYISQFFQLCSIYIDRLNQFCQIANRKISAGQIDDLYKLTKTGKMVEEQSAEFYRLFDDAFLHIYPDFLTQVNKLMREPLIPKEGELLNTDLRILAFMRLGLEDTNLVAQILNYSVNTIYAYRNKIRNRAFDRDNFEKNIMQISSI